MKTGAFFNIFAGVTGGCLLAVNAFAVTPDSNIGSTPGLRPESAPLAGLPLLFQPASAGSVPGKFLARGQQYRFLISPDEFQLVLGRPAAVPADQTPSAGRDEVFARNRMVTRSVRVHFAGANRDARIEADELGGGKVNYLKGSPEKWRHNVPTYAKVRVQGLYSGVDLVYYGNQHQLEYDFAIAPGADPNLIRLRVSGADRVLINDQGELVIALGDQQVHQPKPVLYQTSRGGRKSVEGGYKQIDGSTVGFRVGDYDRDATLVIDPVLSFSTYFGGSDGDIGSAVKVDSAGSIYVAGQSLSGDFTLDWDGLGYTQDFQGGKINGDAFVAKLSNDGSQLIYFTYLGGDADEGILDIAVDAGGRVYATGFTDSEDFPVVPAKVGVPGLSPKIGGTYNTSFGAYPVDAFVSVLTADGSGLAYSTFLGGSGQEVGGGIALDPSGNTYVTGYTFSTNFPVLNPIAFTLGGSTNQYLNRNAGSNDVFVTKIAPEGTGLVYSTYLGGSYPDNAAGIAADTAGYAYVSGYTSSTNFPLTADAWQQYINQKTNMVEHYKGKKTIPFDVFFARIAPGGSELVYSSFFGGEESDSGFRIAVANSGNTFITGSTISADFPQTMTNVIKAGMTNQNYPNSDAFLMKLNPQGQLEASVIFGSTANDVGWDLALNPVTEESFIIGITSNTNFPWMNSPGFPLPEKKRKNYQSVFVTGFGGDLSTVIYSLMLGGESNDYGYAIASDAANNVYLAGLTYSTNFPTVGGVGGGYRSTGDAFVSKILLEPTISAARRGSLMELTWRAGASEYQLEASAESSAGPWNPVNAPESFSKGLHKVKVDAADGRLFYRLRRR